LVPLSSGRDAQLLRFIASALQESKRCLWSVLETSIAPGLLLAMPQLSDANFSHAVVLMIEHGEDGSFGLVVNQPSPIKATELLHSLDMTWGGDSAAVVWSGGPVSPNTGWVLHQPIAELEMRARRGSGTIDVAPGIALTTSPDRLRTIALAPPGQVRLLLGYSGWGPGQLAEEMSRGAWLHVDANPSLIFDCPAPELWSRAIRSLGVNPESLISGRGTN
jgi:putative transcriptional regulator